MRNLLLITTLLLAAGCHGSNSPAGVLEAPKGSFTALVEVPMGCLATVRINWQTDGFLGGQQDVSYADYDSGLLLGDIGTIAELVVEESCSPAPSEPISIGIRTGGETTVIILGPGPTDFSGHLEVPIQ